MAWLLAGLLSISAYILLLDRAQPETGVPLTVTRTEALDQAEAFLQSRGYDLADMERTAGFRSDSSSKQYLEKHLDPALAQHIMAEESPIFYWFCRWYRPMEKEAFYVWLGTEGRVWGFHRTLSDDTPASAELDGDAEHIARMELASFESSEASCRLVSEYKESLPGRTDHYITFARTDLDAGEAEHRIRVVVQGNEVGSVQPYLHLPEYMERIEEEGQAYRSLLWQLSDLPSSLFEAIVLVIFLLRIRDGKARYAFATFLGLAAAVIAALNEMNGWASAWLFYPSTTAPSAYTGQLITRLGETFVSELVYIAMLAIAADGVWRFTRPKLPSLDGPLSRAYWSSRPVFASAIVGICAACIHAGFFSVFYVAGKEWFGVYSPQQSPYNDLMSGVLPWANPLATGFLAAIREELLYRVVMVGLLLRVFKVQSIAIVIPAIIWAFLHSPYPQEPVYIRGLELTCIGIFYGAILLRFGPLATIISHFGYNTLVSGTLLFRSGDPYYQVTGALVVASTALPLVPGLIASLRGRLIATLPAQTDEKRYEINLGVPQYQYPISSQQLIASSTLGLMTIVLAATFVAVAMTNSNDSTADSLRARIGSVANPVADGQREITSTPSEAEEAARSFASDQGVDLSDYRSAIAFRDSYQSTGMDYLYEQTDVKEFYQLRDKYFPAIAYWQLRFFVPGEEEEWYAVVLPDGTAYSLAHHLPEETAGAKPSIDEARENALRHIETQYGLDPSTWTELDQSTAERDARTDHSFAWERLPIEGGGSIRSSIDVVDGRPSGFRTYVHTPETWQRERETTTSTEFAGQTLTVLLILTLAMWLGAYAITAFLRNETEWRRWIGVATIPPVLLLVIRVNDWSSLWMGYPTSVPEDIYYWRYAIGIASNLLQIFASAWLSIVFVHAIAKRFGNPNAQSNRTPRACAVGGFMSYVVVLLFAIANRFNISTAPKANGEDALSAPAPHLLGDYTEALPVLTELAENGLVLLIATVFYLLVASITEAHARRMRRASLVGMITFVALAAASGETGGPLLVAGAIGLIATPIYVSFANRLGARLVGGDLRSRVAIPVMTVLLLSGIQMIGEPDLATQYAGYLIVAIHALGTIWGSWAAYRLDAT